MQILSYEYWDEVGWHFSRVELSKLNLLVGDTGTGKTRFLNTIFNLGNAAVAPALRWTGRWDTTFEQDGYRYKWLLEVKKSETGEIFVSSDNLSRFDYDGAEKVIVRRDPDVFLFDDKELPKLSSNVVSISILKNEPTIQPLYEGFRSVARRSFFEDVLPEMAAIAPIPQDFLERFEKRKDLEMVFHSPFPLNIRLYVLKHYFHDLYERIVREYRSVFPFIDDIQIIDLSELSKGSSLPGKVPIFCIKERNQNSFIPLEQLSSGMQKVLLILTDIALLPEGGIYLIDEYENSLGIGAIDFFPDFLLEEQKSNQFIITSHHPYIINKIPIENWMVFHRRGSEVTIRYGDWTKERFSKSKQQAFIQLINDPFYVQGVE